MAFLAQAIVSADEKVENVVAVSFVEDGVVYDCEAEPLTEAQFM